MNKALHTRIVSASYHIKQLHGGTVGNVQLVAGIAKSADDRDIPYKIVLKTQKKWERYGDPHSWRREYDLYASGLDTIFASSFRWPKCYHAEINNEESVLWIEYIDGTSGLHLTGDMYERASAELGHFQGRLYAEPPAVLHQLHNLSELSYAQTLYRHYRSWNELYDYIRSDDCGIPQHLCHMLIELDEHSDEVFRRIETLPVVLCHRDFWITNILCTKDQTILIDWDTAGWGYLGEDLASLIADESDLEHIIEYYPRCAAAYYKSFSESANLPCIMDPCLYELILVKFGYRLVEGYKFAESSDERLLCLRTLEKIDEMRSIRFL